MEISIQVMEQVLLLASLLPPPPLQVGACSDCGVVSSTRRIRRLLLARSIVMVEV